jgi:hypothetical protein
MTAAHVALEKVRLLLDPTPTTGEAEREVMAAFPADRVAVAEAIPAVSKAGFEGPACLTLPESSRAGR